MLKATIDQRLLPITSAGKVGVKPMRLLRTLQEEFIIRHLTQTSKFDIYAEMGKVCPNIIKIPSIPDE